MRPISEIADEIIRNGVYAGEPLFLRRGINEILEGVAVACEEKILRDAGHGGQWEGYGNWMGDKTGPECAAAVRAMKVVERDY